ncbi:MAG: MFS transporter [Nitrospirota bacterium]|nr:MFS transporter [Nitrospirota bacterium]
MKKSILRNISPTVIALGAVSFLTDLSSEMIYPLLPLFLSTVLGAGAFAIGLIEGIAEMTASVFKIISGYLTDRSGRRRPYVVWGYTLSSLARPLIGLVRLWPLVLVLRFVDRIGKGVRTSPRDALIADVTDLRFRGWAYGFHRAMDHAGAIAGPLVAVLLLKVFDVSLRTVFLLSALPAALVILIVVIFVKERRDADTVSESGEKAGSAPQVPEHGTGHGSLKDFRLFMFAVVVFTLGNSTDAFLLLRLNHAGVDGTGVALLWSAFHIVKMVSTLLGGKISDRIGRKPMVITGWIYYAAIYLLFAFLETRGVLITTFLLYGVYFGLTEPVERAWVASLVPQKLMGRAFGYYNGAVGIASLPASLIFGLIWQKWGYEYAFITGGLFALLGCVLISGVKEDRRAGV